MSSSASKSLQQSVQSVPGNRVLTLRKSVAAGSNQTVKRVSQASRSVAASDDDDTTSQTTISADVAALTRKRRRTKAAIAAGVPLGGAMPTAGTVSVEQFRVNASAGEQYAAFGAMQEDAAIVQQINNAIDQHNEANEHRWYNSYGSVPSVQSLPAAIAAKEKVDWSVDEPLSIEDHWFMPQSINDLAGNESVTRNIIDRWLQVWTRDPLVLPQRCTMMVRGPPGIGKTSAIKLLLHKHGFNNIVEINASDVRSRKLINERLVPLLMNSTCTPLRRTAIVLEEVDGLYNGGGGGGGGTLGSNNNGGVCTFSASVAANGGAVGGGTAAAQSSSSSLSGSDSLIRFFAGTGFKSRQAIGGLVPRCDRCVRGPCQRCADTLASYRQKTCKTRCGEKSKCCATCKKQAEARQRSCTHCGKLPCSVCHDAEPPVVIDGESFKSFRSPVPIIMLANTDFAPFLKSLEELSQLVLFKSVPLGAVQSRLKHLSHKFNIEWAEPALLDTLATRCGGDMRKGVSLLAGVARAAYARKRLLVPARVETIGQQTERKERESSSLFIRACDCEAFIGRSAADMRDATYTIWSALTYAMRECTSLSAVQTLCVENEFRMLPDWIFENYLHCAAQPDNAFDATQRAVALGNMRLIGRAFSEAEVVRSDMAYLSDRLAQSVYMHLGVVLPTMLIRLPKYFGQSDAALAEHIMRPVGLSSSRSVATLQFQKSSLDGENGNAGGTRARAIKERNYYTSTHGLLCQSDTDQYFDFNNYVSKLTSTRAQSAMAFKEENQLVPDHRAVPKATRTKLTKAEKEALVSRAAYYEQSAKQASGALATGAQASGALDKKSQGKKAIAVISATHNAKAASSTSAAKTTAAAAEDDSASSDIAAAVMHAAKRARQTTLERWKKTADVQKPVEPVDEDNDDESAGTDTNVVEEKEEEDDFSGRPERLPVRRRRP